MHGNYQTYEDLKTEVERIFNSKHDFKRAGADIGMDADNSLNGIPLSDIAGGQLADRMGIPRKYFEKMKAVTGLRAVNVNSWLRAEPQKKHLIRTLDGRVRAFLSHKFKPIDHLFITNALMPIFENTSDVQFKAIALTDSRMYLQIVFPRIQGEVRVGEVVQSGITVKNSEVGLGAVDVEHFVYILRCKNGNVGESIVRKVHTGRNVDDDYEHLREETIEADLKAFIMKLEDNLKGVLTQAYLDEKIQRMRIADADKVENPPRVVEKISVKYGFGKDEESTLLMNFGAENKTRWGLINAVTALSHTQKSIDRQYEYEKIGDQILNIPTAEWRRIAVDA